MAALAGPTFIPTTTFGVTASSFTLPNQIIYCYVATNEYSAPQMVEQTGHKRLLRNVQI